VAVEFSGLHLDVLHQFGRWRLAASNHVSRADYWEQLAAKRVFVARVPVFPFTEMYHLSSWIHHWKIISKRCSKTILSRSFLSTLFASGTLLARVASPDYSACWCNRNRRMTSNNPNV
jgi:hypothetical protein